MSIDSVLSSILSCPELFRTAQYFTYKGVRKQAFEALYPAIERDFPDILTLTGLELRELKLRLERDYPFQDKGEDEEDICPVLEEMKNLSYSLNINAETGNFFLVAENKRIKSNVDPNSFLVRMPRKVAQKVKQSAGLAKVTFNPYVMFLTREVEFEGNTFKEYNRFVPPLWRQVYPKAKEEWIKEPPLLFKNVMDRFLPDSKDREIVWGWLANGIQSTNRTILSLRGKRRVGKTLMLKAYSCAIGHFLFPRQDIEKTQFNAERRDKRVIIFDDDKSILSHKTHQIRKTLTDTIQTISEKYIQTKQSEVSHTNYIINSNFSDPFYVEHDERYLISPNISRDSSNFLEEKDFRFLNEMPDRFSDGTQTEEDLVFCAHLGHYLLNHKPIEHFPEGYKSGFFWSDVLSSLNACCKATIYTAIENYKEGEEVRVTLKDANKKRKEITGFDKARVHTQNLVDKLKNLKIEGETVFQDYRDNEFLFNPEAIRLFKEAAEYKTNYSTGENSETHPN